MKTDIGIRSDLLKNQGSAYQIHRDIWSMFDIEDGAPRPFIYSTPGGRYIYCVSKIPPIHTGNEWVIETKQYDPSLLQLAEAMLQHDKDIHGGYAQHDLDYYYNLLSTKIFVHDENSANAKKEAEYCIYCGEPILQNNQQCTSHAVSQCRTTCPDCGQNLRDEKNLVNGEHRCRFKTRITPAAPKAEQAK